MNSLEFLISINVIEPKLVQGTIDRMYAKKHLSSHRSYRKLTRTLLVAAIIIALFAAMCIGAYALNLFGLKDLLMPTVKGWTSDNSTVLSVQGLQNSKEFLAYQEFQTFYDDYKANDHYGDPVPQEMDDWMKAHSSIYFCYTDTLKDKVLSICEKYDLKLRDSRYDNAGLENLSSYIGVDDIITADGYDTSNAMFIAYNDGSFRLQNGITGLSCGYVETDLRRNVKGYFSQGILDFPESVALIERSYTTSNGDNVLVLNAGTTAALVYDGDNAFVTMGIYIYDEADIPDDALNVIADSINFKGLGAASNVNESVIAPTPAPYVPSTDDQKSALEFISGAAVGVGESFSGFGVMGNLEIRVNEMVLSDNAFSAAWKVGDFDTYSYVIGVDGAGDSKAYSFPDYFDQSSGALISGVSLLTVELTVTNNGSGDCDIGAGTNNFPYCLLHLVDVKNMQGATDFYPYNDNIAYSGSGTASGHGACIKLAPGESMTYRLAYAVDYNFALESSFLASAQAVTPGVSFIAVNAASVN